MHWILPPFFALLVWWGGTGALISLARVAERRGGRSLLPFATGVVGVGAAISLPLWDWNAPTGAYLGFTLGVAIWGWHELAFLSGALTGPVNQPCPPETQGFRRFRHAVGTLLYHELALALTWALLGVLAWRASNPVAFWTFFLLWGMRLSAKLNLFAGVPNPNEHLLPPRLSHLASLMQPRKSSVLLPISLLGIGLCTLGLVWNSLEASDPFARTTALLLAGLAGLAGLEHLAMAAPMRLEELWRAWGWESTSGKSQQRPKSLGVGGAEGVEVDHHPRP
jgi:putative photosynthetic complex assembly protein 2